MKTHKISALQPLLILASINFALTACVVPENQQYFEPTPAGIELERTIAGAIPGATPAAGMTPAPLATATPSSSPVSGVPPVAREDGPYEVAQDQTLSISTSELLANDTDPQGLVIHFDRFQNPTRGTLTLNNGLLTFQPNSGFTGSVSFRYQITNSLNLNASALVTINVRRPASELMYGNSGSSLYRYDPNSRTSSSIASFHLANGNPVSVFDIAITTKGLMYGVDGNSLYYIDAATGILSPIPTQLSAFGNINGLTALSDDRLVISGNGIALYDIATHGFITLLAPGSYQSSGDIIALPDGKLYMAINGAGADHLLKIDPHTGAVQDLGSLGRTGVYGLGYALNTLYGFAGTGEVFEINPVNAATSHENNSGVSWFGATTNPVRW